MRYIMGEVEYMRDLATGDMTLYDIRSMIMSVMNDGGKTDQEKRWELDRIIVLFHDVVGRIQDVKAYDVNREINYLLALIDLTIQYMSEGKKNPLPT